MHQLTNLWFNRETYLGKFDGIFKEDGMAAPSVSHDTQQHRDNVAKSEDLSPFRHWILGRKGQA